MAPNTGKGAAQLSSARLVLVVLQLLFAFVVSFHLEFPTFAREHDVPVLGLLFLTIVILSLPTQMLQAWWPVTILAAADTAMLVKLTIQMEAVQPGLTLGYVVVMLMASYLPTLSQYLALGGVLGLVYGLLLFRYGALPDEPSLLIPTLLAMALVYGNHRFRAQHVASPQTDMVDTARPEGSRDALTGLPNRAHFIEQVWRAVNCGKSNPDFHFAVVFIDLDGFKPINDGLGHKAGDAVLRETAKRLQACLRKGDLVGRYGGDEFTLLIHNVTGQGDAIRVAERVLKKIKEPILVGKQDVNVGVSIGIALSTNIHERPEDLIRDADLAMYRAKSGGKGRYEVSNQLLDTKVPAGAAPKLQLKTETPPAGATDRVAGT